MHESQRWFFGMAVLAGAAGAMGQPAPLDDRTGGVLVGDQTVEAVYLTRDLNGDGDALDEGERTLYFGTGNASGLASPTGSVFTIFQSASGWVLIGDGDTDSIYRVRDLNGDGDAQDEGEAGVWFSGAGNAAGYLLLTPNGVWEAEDGATYLLSPGTLSTPGDAIYRTVDLNGDGDAQDEGEATLWMDLEALYPNSSAGEIVFLGETAYFLDSRGAAGVDAIMWARDIDGNGSIGDGEWGEFMDANNPYGAPIGFALKTDGTSLYVVENLSSRTQVVYRLRDIDGSGAIDAADEAQLVWDESAVPAGAFIGTVFTLALGPSGEITLGSSGDDTEDGAFRLRDLNGDGDFFDAGETTQWIGAGAGSGEPASRVRAVEYVLPGVAPCPADFDGSGELTLSDFVAFRNAYTAGDLAADFDGSGTLTLADFVAFRNAYTAGCP